MKSIVIRLRCANKDMLAADMDNEQLGLHLEDAIATALLEAYGFVEIESVTVEDLAADMVEDAVDDTQEQSPISIEALIRRIGRGA